MVRGIRSILLLVSVLVSITSQAVELNGKWQGNLNVGQQTVPIVFNVTKDEGKLTATMDSPMQGATGIPVESVEVNGSNIIFNIKVAAATYEAQIIDNALHGQWKQSGQVFDLVMAKGSIEPIKKN